MSIVVIGNNVDNLFNADKSYAFKVGMVCKESMCNFYLGGDFVCWPDCMTYLGVHF